VNPIVPNGDLSVLLVDDDSHRAGAIERILADAGVISPTDLRVAASVSEARVALAQSVPDLLIVDLLLPRLRGGDPVENGGLELLGAIMQKRREDRPRAVVAITAHDNLLRESVNHFARHGITIVRYEPGASDWQEVLLSRADECVRSLGVGAASNRERVRATVLFALESPEFLAAKRLDWGLERMTPDGELTRLYRGALAPGQTVIAAVCRFMGPVTAATVATKLCHYYEASDLVVAGICAGVRGRVALGDVIAADPCWDWGSGKFTAGTPQEFLPEPRQIHLATIVRDRVRRLADDIGLMSHIWEEWPGQKPESPPRIHIAPFASSAAVVASSAKVAEIALHHRKLAGIDMEAYAAYAAAEESPLPRPDVLSLKSVCDFADEEKSDALQLYAAHVSARLTDAYLRL